jgi:hypothetical protein
MNAHDDTSPDDLLDTFKGRGLKPIIFFTLLVHAVVLLGSSVPFLLSRFGNGDTTGMSEEERVQAAVKEATASLRKIAEEHGVPPQDLSNSLAGKAAGTPTPAAPADEPPSPGPAPTGDPEPEPEKSAIEKELEKTEEGPAVPPIPEDEEVDLFR